MFASEGTKTARVQVDAAQSSRYNFLMTKGLINGVMHSFHSVSTIGEGILNGKLGLLS